MGRLNEKDCMQEIIRFENLIYNLNSKYDNYNVFRS